MIDPASVVPYPSLTGSWKHSEMKSFTSGVVGAEPVLIMHRRSRLEGDGKITKTTPVAQAQGLLVGNRLTKTPKNKISLAAQYDWATGGRARSDARRVGKEGGSTWKYGGAP